MIRMKIEDISSEGLGIGHADGMAVFVKDTVIGDEITAKIIKVKKTYTYGRLMDLVQASLDRTEPVCRVARQCGGCQLQAMDYQAQLRFKENKVRNNLIRIGGFDPELLNRIMEPIIGMEDPFRYRNKAQFPIGTDREGNLIAGFYAGRTHSIIDNHDCALGVKENKEILEIVLEHMRRLGISAYNETTGKGLMRHVMIRYGFRTKQIMVCLVVNGRKIPGEKELVQALTAIPGMMSIVLNVNRENTNVILGREIRLLWGQEYIEDYILSGKPGTDGETLRDGAGVCRPDRQRDGVGSVLRHRHHLFVPGSEGGKSVRRGNRTGSHRGREAQRGAEPFYKYRILCRQGRGSFA